MKRALVTGASRGIGRAIAESLLRDGYEVTGTSRHPEAIRETERLSGVRYLPLDLASEQSINGLTHALGDLDLLVNNAGQSQPSIGGSSVPYQLPPISSRRQTSFL